MFLQLWKGRYLEQRRRALCHIHAVNWDVVALCILLAPRIDMYSLGSELVKESTLVHAGVAFSIARYLRTYMREVGLYPSTLAEWIGVVRSVRLVPPPGVDMQFTTKHFMRVLLTQNVAKDGHANFCGETRGYCIADALYYLYLHEILSQMVKEVLQRLDVAMVARGVERFTPAWWRTVIWVISGRASRPKADFLIARNLFFRTPLEASTLGLTYDGDVADEVTSEAVSKNGHQNGTMARTWETLVPIMSLFKPANVEILEKSRPASRKRKYGKSEPPITADLYSLWDGLQPPILGKSAGYSRKNIVEPVSDAFGKPFPTRVVAGPSTQQLMLGSRGDCENKWSHLGNCSAAELSKRKKRQKHPRQVTSAGVEQLAKIAEKMGPCIPPSITFMFNVSEHKADLPDYLKDHVKQQEQFGQLRHCCTMVFKGGLPPKKHLHSKFLSLLPVNEESGGSEA